MKKLLFLLVMSALFIGVFSQQRHTHFVLTVPAGTDTNYVMAAYTHVPIGFSFSYKRFDDTDATLDIGERPHQDSLIFNRMYTVDSSLPFTLADSTVAFEKAMFNFKYIVFKLTKGSVTAGTTMDLWVSCDKKLPYLEGYESQKIRLMGKE